MPQGQPPPKPTPQEIAFPIVDYLQHDVEAGALDDCAALAAFANVMANFFDNAADYVTSFGVLTPSGGGMNLLGVANNSGAVFLKGNSTAPSGYANQFRDGYGSDEGQNNSDQGHHFAAFLQLGYLYPVLGSNIAPTAWEAYQGTLSNQGDINLGQAAASIGARLRSGNLKPSQIADEIKNTICAHPRRPGPPIGR
jgi:hypothetical protein